MRKRIRGKGWKGERGKREDECVGGDELMDSESEKKMAMTVWWLIEVRKELACAVVVLCCAVVLTATPCEQPRSGPHTGTAQGRQRTPFGGQ